MTKKYRVTLKKGGTKRAATPLTPTQKETAEQVLKRLEENILARARIATQGYPGTSRNDFAQELRTRVLKNIQQLLHENPELRAEEIGALINRKLKYLTIDTLRSIGNYKRRGRERFPQQLKAPEKRLPDQRNDTQIEEKSRRQALIKHIRRVTPKARDRDIMTKYFYGVKIKEIAAEYKLTREAIESVIRNATRRLREDPEFNRMFRE